MSKELKCLQYNISERVNYINSERTIIAICLGHVMLSMQTFDEIVKNGMVDNYGEWIDLNYISKINNLPTDRPTRPIEKPSRI